MVKICKYSEHKMQTVEKSQGARSAPPRKSLEPWPLLTCSWTEQCHLMITADEFFWSVTECDVMCLMQFAFAASSHHGKGPIALVSNYAVQI